MKTSGKQRRTAYAEEVLWRLGQAAVEAATTFPDAYTQDDLIEKGDVIAQALADRGIYLTRKPMFGDAQPG